MDKDRPAEMLKDVHELMNKWSISSESITELMLLFQEMVSYHCVYCDVSKDVLLKSVHLFWDRAEKSRKEKNNG